jgi:hypothetical protein
MNKQPVRLSFQPLIFSQPAVFFSHSKSVNSIFSRLFLAQANRLGFAGAVAVQILFEGL